MPKTDTPEAEVTSQSDAWIAENPGDTITGKVIDLDVAWSDFRARHAKSDPNGGNYPLIVIETPGGQTRKVHAFRTVLYNEIVKRQPKPGETITVTFTGYGKAQEGMSAPHLYRVDTPDRNPEEVAKNVYGRLPNASPAVAPDPPEGEEPIPF